MAQAPDEPVRRPAETRLGDDLDKLSVNELAERVVALREEIARVEAALAHKRGARAAADTLFKS